MATGAEVVHTIGVPIIVDLFYTTVQLALLDGEGRGRGGEGRARGGWVGGWVGDINFQCIFSSKSGRNISSFPCLP